MLAPFTHEHKDNRPSTQAILNNLNHMSCAIADRYFVSMGVLCITLFPQERWSPSRLLKLDRYQCLSWDISEAKLPTTTAMPLSIQVGKYRPTDIIMGDDCVPDELTKMMTDRSAAGSPVTLIKPNLKVYYGIDFMKFRKFRM